MEKSRQFSHGRQANLPGENASSVGSLLEVFLDALRLLVRFKVVGYELRCCGLGLQFCSSLESRKFHGHRSGSSEIVRQRPSARLRATGLARSVELVFYNVRDRQADL